MDTMPVADHATRGPWLAASHPWAATPRRLVSLWNMLRVEGKEFLLLLREVSDIRRAIELGNSDQEDLLFRLGVLLPNAQVLFRRLELDVASAYLRRIRKAYGKGVPSLAQFGIYLQGLEERIEEHLETRTFWYVPQNRLRYLLAEKPFGDAVVSRWPRLANDINEAARCMGAGRYTAAVFHLMRVMEFGVAQLAKALNSAISTDQAWGCMMAEVEKHIKSAPAATPEQKARRRVYRRVASHLGNVRDAWRNPTMHPADSYGEEDAEHVFANVRRFMHILAQRI